MMASGTKKGTYTAEFCPAIKPSCKPSADFQGAHTTISPPPPSSHTVHLLRTLQHEIIRLYGSGGPAGVLAWPDIWFPSLSP